MKLCYVLPQYYKNSSENFFHISNFLSELGKQVDLYLIVEHSDTEPNIQNVKNIYTLNSKSVSLSNFGRLVRLIKIYFELYNNGVSMFFARASLTGVLPLIIANRILNFNRGSVIFWSCGQDVVPLSLYPNKKNIRRIISKLLVRLVFKGINYLATGPEIMTEYYHERYKIPYHKILTLYNDISLDRFYPLTKIDKDARKEEVLGTKKKVMLFVHTFNECRGVDLLPLIARNIRDKKLDVIIVAIGRPGDYSNKLSEEIKVNNFQDCLLNLGEIANKDIATYYQLADLFLMPSRGEGFPRVLLEAMACGCPPISFEVGGVSNILPTNAMKELLVPLGNDKKFINQSVSLIRNQILLDSLSKDSYLKAKNYRTEDVVNMYVNQFNIINYS